MPKDFACRDTHWDPPVQYADRLLRSDSEFLRTKDLGPVALRVLAPDPSLTADDIGTARHHAAAAASDLFTNAADGFSIEPNTVDFATAMSIIAHVTRNTSAQLTAALRPSADPSTPDKRLLAQSVWTAVGGLSPSPHRRRKLGELAFLVDRIFIAKITGASHALLAFQRLLLRLRTVTLLVAEGMKKATQVPDHVSELRDAACDVTAAAIQILLNFNQPRDDAVGGAGCGDGARCGPSRSSRGGGGGSGGGARQRGTSSAEESYEESGAEKDEPVVSGRSSKESSSEASSSSSSSSRGAGGGGYGDDSSNREASSSSSRSNVSSNEERSGSSASSTSRARRRRRRRRGRARRRRDDDDHAERHGGARSRRRQDRRRTTRQYRILRDADSRRSRYLRSSDDGKHRTMHQLWLRFLEERCQHTRDLIERGKAERFTTEQEQRDARQLDGSPLIIDIATGRMRAARLKQRKHMVLATNRCVYMYLRQAEKRLRRANMPRREKVIWDDFLDGCERRRFRTLHSGDTDVTFQARVAILVHTGVEFMLKHSWAPIGVDGVDAHGDRVGLDETVAAVVEWRLSWDDKAMTAQRLYQARRTDISLGWIRCLATSSEKCPFKHRAKPAGSATHKVNQCKELAETCRSVAAAIAARS